MRFYDEPTFLPSEKEFKEARKIRAFDWLFESTLHRGIGSQVDYNLPYPKHEFLRFLVGHKGVLLHGSNNREIDILIPRQANCASKKFGNMKAVYAVTDEILPIFYAIKDKDKFRGVAKSGYSETGDSSGVQKKVYGFAVSLPMAQLKPWSNGMIYIVPKDCFEQGTDDKGNLINEWASRNPVVPLAKLEATPEDFPFLDDIEAIHDE